MGIVCKRSGAQSTLRGATPRGLRASPPVAGSGSSAPLTIRRRWAAALFLSVLAIIGGAGHGLAGPGTPPYAPRALYCVGDDDFAVPLGIVSDVAVDTAETVYLLDRQACTVRRITRGGQVLQPLGRHGEGPGEFQNPGRLTVASDGRCLVLENFVNRAVCLLPDGTPCANVDLRAAAPAGTSAIPEQIMSGSGAELLLSARYSRGQSNASPRRIVATVSRYDPRANTCERLFSTDAGSISGETIAIPPGRSGFALFGWDVNREGTILFLDPTGAFRVFVGHPFDGASEALDLPVRDEDAAAIRTFVEQTGLGGKKARLARTHYIFSVHWLDTRYFMVEPTALLSSTFSGSGMRRRVGAFEVFDRNGSSYGRFEIDVPFNPATDRYFLRRGLLVVVEGGRGAERAEHRLFEQISGLPEQPPDAADQVEEVRVCVYRLFADIRDLGVSKSN